MILLLIVIILANRTFRTFIGSANTESKVMTHSFPDS